MAIFILNCPQHLRSNLPGWPASAVGTVLYWGKTQRRWGEQNKPPNPDVIHVNDINKADSIVTGEWSGGFYTSGTAKDNWEDENYWWPFWGAQPFFPADRTKYTPSPSPSLSVTQLNVSAPDVGDAEYTTWTVPASLTLFWVVTGTGVQPFDNTWEGTGGNWFYQPAPGGGETYWGYFQFNLVPGNQAVLWIHLICTGSSDPNFAGSFVWASKQMSNVVSITYPPTYSYRSLFNTTTGDSCKVNRPGGVLYNGLLINNDPLYAIKIQTRPMESVPSFPDWWAYAGYRANSVFLGVVNSWMPITPSLFWSNWVFDYWVDDPNAPQDRIVQVTGNATYTAMLRQARNNITVEVDPMSEGLAWLVSSGSGTYDLADTVEISAFSRDAMYVFDRWSDGNTNAIRTITVPSGKPVKFTAYFHRLVYVGARVDPAGVGGTVENPDRYIAVGNETTFTAVAAEGYRFKCWLRFYNQHVDLSAPNGWMESWKRFSEEETITIQVGREDSRDDNGNPLAGGQGGILVAAIFEAIPN